MTEYTVIIRKNPKGVKIVLQACQALLQGRWEICSHVFSSNWSIYSLTGKSLPHDVQRTVTVRQPIRRNASPPHIVHFITTSN